MDLPVLALLIWA